MFYCAPPCSLELREALRIIAKRSGAGAIKRFSLELREALRLYSRNIVEQE